MNTWDVFYGPNAGYAQELYDRYLEDPQLVDPATRSFFDELRRLGEAPSEEPAPTNGYAGNGRAAPTSLERAPLSKDTVQHIVVAARLARSIREYGHLAATIDPLGAPRPGDPMLLPSTHHITDEDLVELPATIVWPETGRGYPNCLEAMRALRDIYCGSIGYEFDHVQDFGERTWLHDNVEAGTFRTPLTPQEQRELLQRLTQVEAFERFLHTAFVGQKRFSIEGNDMLVPMLDHVVNEASRAGTHEIVIGMAHRGRLNVLAHVLEKPYEKILAEFQAPQTVAATTAEGPGEMRGWTGDVKYHLGARATVSEGEETTIQITLADNPSHLEVVDPAIEGSARAAQEDRRHPGPPTQDVNLALPVAVHGDAAFPGEGVVAETLNLSGLPGYTTGGTVHIIVNNQIGFTTTPTAGRSTLYASDLAKGFEIPIVHVNADDPEACLSVIRLGYAYRQRFHKDFLVDLVGYRRWGHNEGDEPAFTQPLMYEQIASHPTVRAIYADLLTERGVVTSEEAKEMLQQARERLQTARDAVTAGNVPPEEPPRPSTVSLDEVETAVPTEELRALNEAILAYPEGFSANPKLERVMVRRREALDKPGGIDWAQAEALACASILADGMPIRMTGQDTERGTFSQRHFILHDVKTGQPYVSLQHIPQARASFAIYNSPLTETAVLGFEYGYSVHAPEALVLWEAQFGDFANVAQVVIDQFLVAARAKWRQEPALVLLLPHGYEGQGPEHSSARLERYLQLAAEDNIRIVNCTTAAQYFHILRLQAKTLDSYRRPLVIMTPKSLLRQPRAASSLDALSNDRFHPVLLDEWEEDRARVERLLLSSGKVAVDLITAADKAKEPPRRTALGRVEMLYPFPQDDVAAVIGRFPNLREVVWVQEEPENMGAWPSMATWLPPLLPNGVRLHYVGRPARASTAEGSAESHAREQARIVEEALQSAVAVTTQGGAHGGGD